MAFGRRVVAAALVGITGLGVALIPVEKASAAITAPAQVWERTMPDGFVESSPNVGVVNGQQAVVVGNHDGNLYAMNAANGNDVSGWPRQTGNGIDSSPAIADVDGNGSNEVFVGSGTSAVHQGKMWGFNSNGSTRWSFNGSDAVDPSVAFFSSPAVGDVNYDGVPDVSGFTLGLNAWNFNARTGGVNPGWPIYQDDSVFSSPALADIDGDGQTDYVVGGDSSAGSIIDWDGGIVRAVRGDGTVIWQFRTGDIIRSSPVVADINGDGAPEIIVGSGDYWVNYNGTPDASKLWVLNRQGQLLWSRQLVGHAMASPAVADVNGDGRLDIIEPTWNQDDGSTGGRINVFDGSGNMLPNWGRADSPSDPNGQTYGGSKLGQAVTADFNGDGAQDILVGTNGAVVAYDGRTGNRLFALKEGIAAYQNSPWVGDLDGNGRLDIVIAGRKPNGEGIATRFEFASTTPQLGANGWNQFRKDARHTGSTIATPFTQNRCDAVPRNSGYAMTAADGGVFTYCRDYHGSAGDIRLNQPIVGSDATPNNAGYWLVARDGGIFTYGDAAFYGSTGDKRLNQPIVGMSSTPDGKGYWLVAADGGIFTFGNAQFYGSTGDIKLNQPILGMASTPSGKGYWLVAADGGIFTFGDAAFYGSTGDQRLNKPVVGMAATPSGRGYWLVASDGGIFTFGDAPFHGSTGSIRLNQPIIGMIPRSDSQYWLIARDGGVFTSDAAPYLGSAGGIRLNQPIVAGM